MVCVFFSKIYGKLRNGLVVDVARCLYSTQGSYKDLANSTL